MKLIELFEKLNIDLSFEVFPPKTEQGLTKLLLVLKDLAIFKPKFISVTYGAGGSNQEKSLETVFKIKQNLNLEVVPHYTCVGATKESVLDFTKKIKDNGINKILALRGDIPKENKEEARFKNSFFQYASDLVKFIKEVSDLEIIVACYPEKHPEALDLKTDINHLKNKLDKGASLAISQLFYENEIFFNFVKIAKKLGVNNNLVPGIMPILSLERLQKTIALSGAKIPQKLKLEIDKVKNNSINFKKLGIDFAKGQIKDLIEFGSRHIHLYIMNSSESIFEILESQIN